MLQISIMLYSKFIDKYTCNISVYTFKMIKKKRKKGKILKCRNNDFYLNYT